MNYSLQFMAELQKPRVRPWELPYGAKEPLMPWITPEIPPKLRELFVLRGLEKELKAGEPIYGRRFGLDKMAYVTNGMAARCFGMIANHDKEGFALTIPGRIAGGNHTFHSRRPGNGSYFAITPARVLMLDNRVIKLMMQEDDEFRQEVEVQLECLIQSDRIGLAANMGLSVKDRIALQFLSWAFAYGRLSRLDDHDWIECDIVLPIPEIARIVCASVIQVQRELTVWKNKGYFLREGGKVKIRCKVLDKAWEWLRGNEEDVCEYRRNKTYKAYLT